MDEDCVTFSVHSTHFQCAFVAMRYFWGARGEELGEALSSITRAPAKPTAELLAGLTHPERGQRAAALGAELAKLSAALDQRSLPR